MSLAIGLSKRLTDGCLSGKYSQAIRFPYCQWCHDLQRRQEDLPRSIWRSRHQEDVCFSDVAVASHLESCYLLVLAVVNDSGEDSVLASALPIAVRPILLDWLPQATREG